MNDDDSLRKTNSKSRRETHKRSYLKFNNTFSVNLTCRQ